MIEQKRIPSKSYWGGATGSKIVNILCSDGKQRLFTATAEADTFFTVPGVVKVNGVSVSGHAFHDSMVYHNDQYPDGLWKFTAYQYRKNGHLLPEWKKVCSGCHEEINWGEEVHTFSYYYWHKEHLEAHDREMALARDRLRSIDL